MAVAPINKSISSIKAPFLRKIAFWRAYSGIAPEMGKTLMLLITDI
jgi:hypothetical protein